MNPFRKLVLSLGLVGLGLVSGSLFAGSDNSEQNKRTEFGKAYASAKPEERRAALDMLKGCQERTTLGILMTVARMDKDKDVRVAALQAACGWNDTDGSLTGMVVAIVQEEKDREAKRQMIQCFPKLPLKHNPIVETMKLLCSLSYPEYNDSRDDRGAVDGGGKDGGGSVTSGHASQEAINKLKAYYDDILQVLNTLTAQHFTGSSKTRNEVKTWWSTHEADVVKADREALDKLRGTTAPAKKDTKAPAIP